MSKRSWFCTAFVSLLFVHVFAWYKIPVEVYLRSSETLATPLVELAGRSLIFGAFSLLISVLASYFVFLPLRKPAATILLALTVTFWIIYSLFGQLDPVIDKNFQRIDLERYRAVLELMIFLVTAAMLVRYRKFFHATALILLTLATVYYAGATSRLVAGHGDQQPAQSPADSLYSISAGKNLLLLQMGGFQSEYFAEWLEREPGLSDSLDGFYYFPDTLGAASRSGPVVDAAIHAGYPYDPFIPMENVRADYLDGGSVFSKLAMAGADVQIVQRDGPCPYLAKCIDKNDIRRDTDQVQLAETLHAIDSALLIMSPEPLKNFVYRGGRWLLGSLAAGGSLEPYEKNVFDDHALLEMFADKLRSDGANSSVRYLQLGNTRAPGLLMESCKARPGLAGSGRHLLLKQARCGLLDLQRILDSLRASGLYANTAIVVLADTGAIDHNDARPGDDVGRVINSANPLLLIKPMNSIGPLKINPAPARLTDLPKTLCGLSDMCRWPNGNDLLVMDAVNSEPRQYLAYAHGEYNPDLGLVTGGERFQVNGPANRPESWSRLVDNSTVEITGELQFSTLDDERIFGNGWGVVEIDPTAGSKRWVWARTAQLSLPLEPGSDYLLEFRVYPAPGIDGQSMEMLINGHWVGRHPAIAGLNTLTFAIPGQYIMPGNDSIELSFAKLAEPVGQDERQLAMSFFQLQICRVVPEFELESLQTGLGSE